MRTAVEASALIAAGLIGVMAVLGRLADWFEGTGLWFHILPFAGAVLALGIATAVVLRAWLTVRRWVARWHPVLPAAIAIGVAAGSLWFATRPVFREEMASLRTLVGGPAEAERVAIAHQVYAAYRRSNLVEMRRMLERAQAYQAMIADAAAAFGVDSEVLTGIGAAESSFYPRDSTDGGRGLFQITAPPRAALRAARKRLGLARLDPVNQRQNTFVAAATLRHYLDAVHGDLFLALLAYNVGPRNGGLVSIMRQYGARDFVTIQPYLHHLPRDYPIRVLAAALAYRLWRREGRLPRYEDADNARRIQQVGIPGLETGPMLGLRAITH